jgi:phosphopantetheine--protein transferase-like protein
VSLRGIGIDIGSIPRMAGLVERYGERFIGRWFDASELAEGGSSVPCQLASRFAAKEAVWKALRIDGGTSLPWRQILITSAAPGSRLSVRLEGELGSTAAALGIGPISVSATVHGDMVIAIALAEQTDRQ